MAFVILYYWMVNRATCIILKEMGACCCKTEKNCAKGGQVPMQQIPQKAEEIEKETERTVEVIKMW